MMGVWGDEEKKKTLKECHGVRKRIAKPNKGSHTEWEFLGEGDERILG